MNDFTGFTFDNIHSSTLGIISVSDGSRYNKDLLPPIQDYTMDIPGGDGSYYFGCNYKSKIFNISFAFDSVSEQQIRQIKNVFSGQNIAELIFDEEPYKKYLAKATTLPTIKFICFDNNGQRVYKGEGTLSFTAFFSYGISTHKYLDDFSDSTYLNKDEWALASNLKENQEDFDYPDLVGGSYDTYENDTIYIYNAGDIEANTIFHFTLPNTDTLTITKTAGDLERSVIFDISKYKTKDITIDTKKNLILIQNGDKTEVCNNIITNGELKSLQLSLGNQKFYFSSTIAAVEDNEIISYNYYYL